MKVLSIGNSFSQDAHAHLHGLATIYGVDMEIINLYIGGCSLETHWNNIVGNHAAYVCQRNGIPGGEMVSVLDGLQMEAWDVITIQQVSQNSGQIESYEPFLTDMAAYIHRHCPNAQLWFHQTWAYEIESTHWGFSYYNRDQRQMFASIVATTEEAAAKIGAKIIPCGRTIQFVRENIPEFEYLNGGRSLCRDTYHLCAEGRIVAALTWVRALTGEPLTHCQYGDFDAMLLGKMIDAVNAVFEM